MSVISRTQAWLRLFRAHTAMLEAPLAVLGAGLALGSFWKPIMVFWLFFGIMYHFVGYGMNSYVDWKKGFDKDDPRKQHHPLNTGEIEKESAKRAILIGLLVLILYGLALGGFGVIAFASMIVMLLSGVTYNYLGKYTTLKFIPIAVVHTMVFVYPYILYEGSLIELNDTNIVFGFMACGYFIHHVFQIMISGDIKDLDRDEASFIKVLGSEVKKTIQGPWLYLGMPVVYIAFVLVIAQIVTSVTAIYYIAGLSGYVFIASILAFWMLYEADKLMKVGHFRREKRVVHMSRKELAGYMLIHSAAAPVLGYLAFAATVGFMFIYLFGMSKFLWGNWVKPEV